MIETLRDAPPLPAARPPVELLVSRRRGKRLAGAVRGIDLVQNPLKVRRECRHGVILT
jgi:hypothetical protein